MDIIRKESRFVSEDSDSSCEYVNTLNYLAWCIIHIEENGYNNDYHSTMCTKHTAWTAAVNGLANEEYLAQAQTIIDFYLSLNDEDISEFDSNLKTVLSNQYLKANSFIAYAPLAYSKVKLRLARELVVSEAALTSCGKDCSYKSGVPVSSSIRLLAPSVTYGANNHMLSDAHSLHYKPTAGHTFTASSLDLPQLTP